MQFLAPPARFVRPYEEGHPSSREKPVERHRAAETIERRSLQSVAEPAGPADLRENEVVEKVDFRPAGMPLFFHAESRGDGTYTVTLTEDGLRTFETALGVANDLGGQTRISTYSTIADIMERTAAREELSAVMREPPPGLVGTARVAVLRCRLWGSEEPSTASKIAGHLGKLAVIALILLWTLVQIGTAISDIAAIPGILAGIPHDILNLHPTSAITDVGQNIADAGTHGLYAVVGFCLAYVTGAAIKPMRRIYRHDQIIPGERTVVGALAAVLRRASTRA